MAKTLILIPSRMAAKRLPGKPLLKINGISMISNVYKKALETNIGEVFVATEDKEIHDDVINNGGKSILTGNHHNTGTDRIFEAYKKLDITGVDYILNLQGDEPMLDKNDIINLNNRVLKLKSKIGTLACEINNQNDDKYYDKNVVKVKTKNQLSFNESCEAESFFRVHDNKDKKNIYHHIGIYQYSVSTLEKITSLSQTKNEKKLNLEQLRAMDNNISIDVILAKVSPIGIDSLEDYKKVKNLLETKNF
tara:strand:+ start:8959 stop:9708 length:750 start_codon:yes stop_codon:yes gene_type:complete